MKKLIRNSIFLGITLCVVALCACSNQGSGSSGTGEVKNLTDAYGRQVQVPENAKTCATVGSGARFVVYAGAQDKLVAVTDMEDEAVSRPYTVAWAEKFAPLPHTSNGNHLMETSVNEEELLKIKPDLIVSSRSAKECDDLQNDINIPVVGISSHDKIFDDEVYNSIQCVGEALGTSDHAKQVVAKIQSWQKELQDRTGSIPDDQRPGCYAGAVNYKGAKSFTGTYSQYPPFVASNVKNVADGVVASGAVDVSLEQLGQWNPAIMFLNTGNMELMKKDYEANKAFFDQLRAFQNNQLYSQPSYNMNGTNIETAICDAFFDASVVYADKFTDLDMESKYREIYSVMLGKDCYNKLKEQGLAFEQISFN